MATFKDQENLGKWEFICPICEDFFLEPVKTVVCQHRFCYNCFVRAVFITKQCPLCFEPVPTKRSYRFDFDFKPRYVAFMKKYCKFLLLFLSLQVQIVIFLFIDESKIAAGTNENEDDDDEGDNLNGQKRKRPRTLIESDDEEYSPQSTKVKMLPNENSQLETVISQADSSQSTIICSETSQEIIPSEQNSQSTIVLSEQASQSTTISREPQYVQGEEFRNETIIEISELDYDPYRKNSKITTDCYSPQPRPFNEYIDNSYKPADTLKDYIESFDPYHDYSYYDNFEISETPNSTMQVQSETDQQFVTEEEWKSETFENFSKEYYD